MNKEFYKDFYNTNDFKTVLEKNTEYDIIVNDDDISVVHLKTGEIASVNREEICDEKLYNAVVAALVDTGFTISVSFTTIYFEHEKQWCVFEIENAEFNPEFIRKRLDDNIELVYTKEFEELDAILSTVIRQYKITNIGF